MAKPLMDQHELIASVKNLAIDLGRTPKKVEFYSQVKGGESGVNRYFSGSYLVFLTAAGLERKETKTKIDNSVFNKSIEEHIQSYEPVKYKEREKPYPSALIIGDIHWPFCNNFVVDKFIEYTKIKKPEFVIINGDAWDFFSHSKFPRSHNLFTPRDEQTMCMKMNKDFWEKIIKGSPKSKCFQLLGNHDIRPMKRILESYPEAEDWISERLNQLFTFDGVKTIFDPRQELMIAPDVAVFHGYRTGLGNHRDFTLMNTINGHSHIGGTVFRQIRGQTLWELNSGFAGDQYAKGLTYTNQSMSKQTPGFAELDANGPRFIPL